MALITHDNVSRLKTRRDLDKYICNLLKDTNRDAVASDLGLVPGRFELPFFHASAALRQSLVLSEVYRLSGVTGQHAASNVSVKQQEDFAKIVKELGGLRNKKIRFLDLTYARGGMADMLLEAYGDANGLGVTPSQNAASVQGRRDAQPNARLQVHCGDVRSIAAGETTIGNGIPHESFSLVIADATITLSEDIPLEDQIQWIYAVLLVASRYITLGGSLVIPLQARPIAWIVDVVAALTRQMFTWGVTAIRPQNIQVDSQIIYLICRGYGGSNATRELIISSLFKGMQCLGNTARLPPRISGAGSDEALLTLMKQPFIEVFEQVWSVQYETMHKYLQMELLRGNEHGFPRSGGHDGEGIDRSGRRTGH